MQSWSNLPVDISCLILQHLHYIDQIRFRAVCQSWRSSDFVQYVDKLPWLMTYDSEKCYLFDPSHKQTYCISTKKELNDSEVLHSKYGWVLYKSRMQKESSLFFYTPFTGKIIELPKLPNHNVNIGTLKFSMTPHHNCYYYKVKAAFSNTPDSPDCVVFVLQTDYITRKDHITTCKVGDETWTEYLFDYENGVDSVEYADGVFYCASSYPKAIRAFNVVTKDWKVLPYPEREREAWNDMVGSDYLIECDEKLLMAHHISDCEGWRVLRLLDGTEVEWDEMSVFLGNSSMAISVEKGSELSGMVHFYQLSCYFDCVSFFSCEFTEVPEGRTRLLYPKLHEDYDWYHLEHVWLHPPHPRS